jgi:hypothetical protein
LFASEHVLQGLAFDELPVSWMFMKSKILEQEFVRRQAKAQNAAAAKKVPKYKPSFAP